MKFRRLLICSALAMVLMVVGLVPRPTRAAGNVLVMGSLVELYNIDPAVGQDEAIGSTLKQLYDSLFRYQGDPPKAQPWLADSYTVSDNGLEWTFKLRKEAKFHDGSPVNADAVKFSADRLMRVNQAPASLFTGIIKEGSVSVVDATTVKFTLLQPYGPFPDILTWLFIVNPAVVKANSDKDGQTFLAQNEAGSGPFKIKRWQAGELYEFEAVQDYWRGWPKEGHLDGYIRQVIPEASARRVALESGKVHMIDWMSVDDQVALSSKPDFFVVHDPTITVYDVKMNTKTGPTADVNVRQAIAYATDYNALAAIWQKQAAILTGPLPPALSFKDVPGYTQDLDKAKAALKQSKWPDGGFDLNYVYVTGLEDERRTGLVLADSLKKLNINLKISAVAWADAVATFTDPKTSPQLFPLYSSTAYADPDNYLWSAFNSALAGNWTNPGHYTNPDVDKLLTQARAERDAAKRSDLYKQAVTQILKDSPNLFVSAPPDYHLFSSKIGGYQYCPPMGSDEDFYYMYLKG